LTGADARDEIPVMIELTRNGAVFTDLLLEIFRVNRLLLDAGDAVASPAGMTSAQWQVLGVVEHGPTTVSEVAAVMGLTCASVRATADGLLADALIVRVEDAGRSGDPQLALTPNGRDALARVQSRHAEWATRVGWELSMSDMRVALRALRQIRETLDPQPAERD
jgi:DNA-binding MarR family transcriptional regulator